MNYLVIAVIAIAVAQVLTMLLTIGREREIKQLRERINEQRIIIVELRAWVVGIVQSAQPRRMKSEPIREPTVKVPEPAPKQPPDTLPPRPTEDEDRMNKAINWLKEDADKAREVVSALRGAPPPPKKIG